MSRLSPAQYLEHLRADARRFRDVLAGCDPDARVPGCPDWTAADLLWHLTEVHWFWSGVVEQRPAPPEESATGPERPGDHPALLAAFDAQSARLVAALEGADAADPAWSWSEDQTVGFTFRRQAHEALVHRVDAEQAAGAPSTIDTALAADGVEECLDVMYGGTPPWGEFEDLPHHVEVQMTDVGESVWVQIGMFRGTNPADGVNYDGRDIRVVPDPGVPADACVRGPAAALDLWLWGRGDFARVDEQIKVSGDRAIYDHFREAVSHAID